MCCTSRISPSPLDFKIMWMPAHRQDFPILVVMKKLLCFLGLGKKIYDLQQKTHTYSLSCFFYLTNLIVTFVCDLLLKLTMTAPALKGSMNVLRACTKSPSVKRVVMTSSCSAIRYDYNRSEKDPPLDETVWSNIEYCREYKVWAQFPIPIPLKQEACCELTYHLIEHPYMKNWTPHWKTFMSAEYDKSVPSLLMDFPAWSSEFV